MFKLFRDGKIWTIPNVLSFFRFLLVPFIIWSCICLKNTTLTVVLLAVSALTDVLDGQIARRFHMISELGKALDPLADKLTQVSIVLCLALTYPLLWGLLAACVLRESWMAILSYRAIRKTKQVYAAKWYGKLSTVVLDSTTLLLLIFPNIPQWFSTLLIVLSMLCVVLAMVLYTRFFLNELKQAETQKPVH